MSVHSTSRQGTQPHILATQVSNEPWPYPRLPSLVRGWLQHQRLLFAFLSNPQQHTLTCACRRRLGCGNFCPVPVAPTGGKQAVAGSRHRPCPPALHPAGRHSGWGSCSPNPRLNPPRPAAPHLRSRAHAGVTLNELFPNWLLVIILSLMLAVLSVRTLLSGLRLHASEVRGKEGNNEEVGPWPLFGGLHPAPSSNVHSGQASRAWC